MADVSSGLIFLKKKKRALDSDYMSSSSGSTTCLVTLDKLSNFKPQFPPQLEIIDGSHSCLFLIADISS